MSPSPNQPQWTEAPEVTDLSRLEREEPASVDDAHSRLAATETHQAVLGREGDRFRLLAENASDIIYLYRVKPEARYEYVSPSVTRLTGYSPEEHYDDPEITLKMAHPHDRPLLAALIRAPSAFSDPVTIRLVRKDGSLLWTEHRIAAIYDATANVVAIEGIARDITERREAEDELWRTVETLRHALERLRHVSFELRPPALDTEGLIPALRVYLEKLREEHGIRFELVDHLDLDPPLETRTTIYRIAQEALANVRKHADADRVHVLAEQQDRGYLVRVQDDGDGFDLSRGTTVPGHLGLLAMRERAELAGGWWKCRSAPGAGTTVEFWVPRETTKTGSVRGPGS